MSNKTLKVFLCIDGILLLIIFGLLWSPQCVEFREIFLALGFVLTLGIIGLGLLFQSKAAEPLEAHIVEDEAAPEIEKPDIEAIPEQSGEVQVVQLLAGLQQKGRFLDFVMNDIKAYSDTQVAAAARVVHQGCKSALLAHISIEPISQQKENQKITLEADYERNNYRLVGKMEGAPPYTGKLLHKGWKTTRIELPKVTGERANAKSEHVLSAAEVEFER